MTKKFNNKKIELLAPAGNMDIFKKVVQANCDAVYIGGKSLNMRMIRKGFNFSKEELRSAVIMAHNLNKKIYITVNNMINDFETEEAKAYLHFLETINIDGIIVQDLGILQICKEENFNSFEIHSSVMMNAHNIEFVKTLKDFGVSRVVLSRQMDLAAGKLLQLETGIETEYFVHGDICAVNDANCYYSSVLWGNSSNRGRCFKPCRWPYSIKKDGSIFSTQYPLAAKDMCMYEYIPELIEANVTSFKIEGRMRSADFIVDLINIYGQAIDDYIENPLGYDRKEYSKTLFEHRKRDFTTAYAFSKPNLDFINTRYEGTGKFYSTGKVFSSPTEEPELTQEIINMIDDELNQYSSNQSNHKKCLSVKVNNFEQGKLCIELGVDRVYIPIEVLKPDAFITLQSLKDLVAIKNSTELYLALPLMMDELQFDKIDHYLEKYGHLFDGLLASNLGAIKKYSDQYNIITDNNVNIYNNKAVNFYRNLGAKEFTLSIETKADELGHLINTSKGPLELIVHGPLRVMYLDYNLYKNIETFEKIDKADNKYVNNNILVLMTDQGENPVYIDDNQKNHLYTSKEFCLLPNISSLAFDEIKSFRIEGQTYSINELRDIIKIYQRAIEKPYKSKDIFKNMKSLRAGFTAGSLSYKANINEE